MLPLFASDYTLLRLVLHFSLQTLDLQMIVQHDYIYEQRQSPLYSSGK
jgi:hypothetical protein